MTNLQNAGEENDQNDQSMTICKNGNYNDHHKKKLGWLLSGCVLCACVLAVLSSGTPLRNIAPRPLNQPAASQPPHYHLQSLKSQSINTKIVDYSSCNHTKTSIANFLLDLTAEWEIKEQMRVKTGRSRCGR